MDAQHIQRAVRTVQVGGLIVHHRDVVLFLGQLLGNGQRFRRMERYCFRVLCDYRNLLRRWKRDYAPKTPDEDFHPLFVEALQKQDYVDYLLDVLLSPDMEERAAFIIDCGKEVSNLERRMAELAAGDTAGRRTDHARSTATPER